MLCTFTFIFEISRIVLTQQTCLTPLFHFWPLLSQHHQRLQPIMSSKKPFLLHAVPCLLLKKSVIYHHRSCYCIIPVVYLVPLSAFIILEGKKGDKLISVFSASTSLPGTQWALLKVGNRFKLISQSFCDLILPVILTKLPQIIFSLREQHGCDSH